MGTFKLPEHKRQLTSMPVNHTQSLSQLSRPFAPLPAFSTQQTSPVTQEQVNADQTPRLRYSLANIPILPTIQRKGIVSPSIHENLLASRIQAARSSGHALGADTQQKLEQGLGAKLPTVRVHIDSEADHLSRAVGAAAFTTGPDIFFRSGLYKPHSLQGLHLLAHEATHVVQQAAEPVAAMPGSGSISFNDPDDPFEHAANLSAAQITAQSTLQSESARDSKKREPTLHPRGLTPVGNRVVPRLPTQMREAPRKHPSTPLHIQRFPLENLPKDVIARVGHFAPSDADYENLRSTSKNVKSALDLTPREKEIRKGNNAFFNALMFAISDIIGKVPPGKDPTREQFVRFAGLVEEAKKILPRLPNNAEDEVKKRREKELKVDKWESVVKQWKEKLDAKEPREVLGEWSIQTGSGRNDPIDEEYLPSASSGKAGLESSQQGWRIYVRYKPTAGKVTRVTRKLVLAINTLVKEGYPTERTIKGPTQDDPRSDNVRFDADGSVTVTDAPGPTILFEKKHLESQERKQYTEEGKEITIGGVPSSEDQKVRSVQTLTNKFIGSEEAKKQLHADIATSQSIQNILNVESPSSRVQKPITAPDVARLTFYFDLVVTLDNNKTRHLEYTISINYNDKTKQGNGKCVITREEK